MWFLLNSLQRIFMGLRKGQITLKRHMLYHLSYRPSMPRQTATILVQFIRPPAGYTVFAGNVRSALQCRTMTSARNPASARKGQ
jgi:hypothetical protein